MEENRVGNDATLAFRRAVEFCRQHRVRELVVPAGTYDIYPDLAFEKYKYVTNNSAGLKRLLFDLDGMEEFTLRGEGAHLVLHGYVSAFSVAVARISRFADLRSTMRVRSIRRVPSPE